MGAAFLQQEYACYAGCRGEIRLHFASKSTYGVSTARLMTCQGCGKVAMEPIGWGQ